MAVSKAGTVLRATPIASSVKAVAQSRVPRTITTQRSIFLCMVEKYPLPDGLYIAKLLLYPAGMTVLSAQPKNFSLNLSRIESSKL